LNKQSTFIFGLTILLLLSFHAAQGQSTKKRQLKPYENGGEFDFSWGVVGEIRRARESKLLDFLSNHWRQKKLARVVFRVPFTIHGDTIVSTFYIEPDASGRWNIAEEWESFYLRRSFSPKQKSKLEIKKGKAIYETIETVEKIIKQRISFSG